MPTYMRCPNNKEENLICPELSSCHNEIAILKRRLEPKQAKPGGVCQAIEEHGSTCENQPLRELFVPALSQKPFVLCSFHCNNACHVFTSLGIFYKSYEHTQKPSQRNLFKGESGT
jgi:hypothetical protein